MKKIIICVWAMLFVMIVIGEALAKKNMVLGLRGTAIGYDSTVSDIDGDGVDDDALCFDVGVYDVESGRQVGTGADCLSNITPVGDSIALVGTTFFNLPEGELVSRGLTSVQPTTHGSPDVSHITGSIPSAGDNSILSGTHRYGNASGPVRLSGAVKMEPQSDGTLQITFDCIFVISID